MMTMSLCTLSESLLRISNGFSFLSHGPFLVPFLSNIAATEKHLKHKKSFKTAFSLLKKRNLWKTQSAFSLSLKRAPLQKAIEKVFFFLYRFCKTSNKHRNTKCNHRSVFISNNSNFSQ